MDFFKSISCSQNAEAVAVDFQFFLTEQQHAVEIVDNGEVHLICDATIESDFILDFSTGQIIGKTEANLFFGATKYWVYQVMGEGEGRILYQAQVKERCLMLDIGRKFFSLDSLKALVRSLSFFQFTHLQLHFSENEGFRIESETHPEVVSKKHLKKSDVRELISYAQRHYIEIIPDFDSPGHLRQVLQHYPEWQLPMTTATGEKKQIEALDILNPLAVAYIHSFYAEYAELFCGSRYFHIGADEFIDFDQLEHYPKLKEDALAQYGETASGMEPFINYVNETIRYVHSLGFVARVWNDGFFRLNRKEGLYLSTDCQISYWTKWHHQMAPVDTFLSKGYCLVNHNDNYLYYVLGEAAGYQYPTYEKIAADFDVTLFSGNQSIGKNELTQIAALALSVWADLPTAKTEGEVLKDIFWLQGILSQKVYGEKPVAKQKLVPLFDLWLRKVNSSK